MPINTREDLSQSNHILPALTHLCIKFFVDSEGDIFITAGPYKGYGVAVCNSNQLYVSGSAEFAKLLMENIQPFGYEHIVNLYPPIERAKNKSWLSKLFGE